MAYVDGFAIPIPSKSVDAYRQIARKASRVWLDHGALEYRECVGDDLNVKMGLPFTRGIRLRKGETGIFSWIVYKSRAHRDRVNAKVLKDERIAKIDPKAMPFRREADDVWRLRSDRGRSRRVRQSAGQKKTRNRA